MFIFYNDMTCGSVDDSFDELTNRELDWLERIYSQEIVEKAAFITSDDNIEFNRYSTWWPAYGGTEEFDGYFDCVAHACWDGTYCLPLYDY
jgi:hypothetical protein